MRADEGRRRMPGDHRLEAVDDLVERAGSRARPAARRPARPEMPVGLRLQLLPALVGLVERLEERDRVGDVDRDGDGQLAGRGPQRVEPAIVDRDEPAIGSRARRPSVFQTFRPRAPAADTVPQPRGLRLAERRVVGPAVVVEAGEHRDAAGQRLLPPFDLAPQRLAPSAVEVDDAPRRRPRPASAASSLGESARSSRRRTPTPRWLCASIAGNRGRGTTRCRPRACDRGRKSRQRSIAPPALTPSARSARSPARIAVARPRTG